MFFHPAQLLPVLATLVPFVIGHPQALDAADTAVFMLRGHPKLQSDALFGLSEDCQAALDDPDTDVACFDELADAASVKDQLVAKCDALLDGTNSRCSKAQAERALDILETHCVREIEVKHPTVVSLYTRWYTYTPAVDVLCAKDEQGEYCDRVDEDGWLFDDDWECLPCVKRRAEIVRNWSPSRSAGVASFGAEHWLVLNDELLHHCGLL
jgi:hypothetical protein